ncbi:SAF domain-containing protein [Bacillus salipaludis]|uniref:SAF domain-containing protein n=1 Tax=Bacillus salipaludis TaxID=2547811 RepID=A0AA90R8W2_9BACI|nr:SAF domain-containing protein [Bacillus salipaludis]MDQ6598863.1 SAF domain-containing protein [Bacillus salipaludis]
MCCQADFPGEDILKYGEVIGLATTDIEPGEHVHIHNLEGKRGRGDKVEVK